MTVLYLPHLMISPNAREDQELVGVWASRLQKWGIGGVAPLAVEVLRPLGFLGAQAVHMLAPILTAFTSPAEVERLARLLESPGALDRLSQAAAQNDRSQPPERS